MVKCYRFLPYVKYILPFAGLCLLFASRRSDRLVLDAHGLNTPVTVQRFATENKTTIATHIEDRDKAAAKTTTDDKLVAKVPSGQKNATLQVCEKKRESDIVEYFKGLKDATIDINTPVTISPFNVCVNGSKDPYVLIIIASTEQDVKKRQAVRDTWASFSYNTSLTLPDNATVGVVFIVAGNDSKVSGPELQEEVKQYGDVLWLNMEESYTNLIFKVFAGMRWMADNCRDTQFLLKVDIDVYVHLPRLVAYLKSYQQQRVVIGRRHLNAGVFREGRWRVTLKQYKFCNYLSYAEGNSYVIAAKLVPDLLNAARCIQNFFIEDAFITGVLRSVVGGTLVDSKRFSYFEQSIDRSDLSKFYKDGLISETRCTVEIMSTLWSLYKSHIGK